MKFSYNWLRELVPGLKLEVTRLAQEITMKTAECEGIHDPGAFSGASIAEVAAAEQSQPDSIIEIDNKSLTNRPDLWGHLGMAREVAAICGLNVADPVEELPPTAERGAVSINITDASLCSRYSAQLIAHVTVAPSPLWLQYRLHSLGLTPINNLVDVTNYVLCELGQPMHAYDADLLGNKIVVRAAGKGESILALNGQTYSLGEEDIVIADASRSVGIAGIIGGNDTAIRSTTKRIVLEAASFPAAHIRKTSARLKLRTDASMRFEKGQDPENTTRGLVRAVELLKQISPGAQPSAPIDSYVRKATLPRILLDLDWAEKKLGRKLSTDEVVKIFKSLVFGVEPGENRGADNAGARKLLINVPSWRATKDISIPEDLVEEIGRMVGYASIVPQAPAVLAAPTPRNLQHEQYRDVRAALTGQGFTEAHNYSFISDADLAAFGYAPAELLQIANPISPEQKYLRPSLLPGVRKNIIDNSRYFSDFRLFEIGREYSKGKNGVTVERTHLVATICGRETDGACLTEMKRVAQYLVPNGITVPGDGCNKAEHPERSARIEVAGTTVGRIFELHPGLLDRGRAAILNLDLDAMQSLPVQTQRYRPLRRFPTSSFDLSVVASAHELVRNIEDRMRQSAKGDLVALQFLLIFPLPAEKKSVSFRLTIGADDHTLTTEEVAGVRERVVAGIKAAGWDLRE